MTMDTVKKVQLDVVHQEIQGPTHSSNVTGKLNQPFETRTIKSFEVVDNCPSKDDSVSFRLPLRGIPNLAPTLKNVLNKFSVRYYLKLVITEEKEEEEENTAMQTNDLLESEVSSSLYELNLWR